MKDSFNLITKLKSALTVLLFAPNCYVYSQIVPGDILAADSIRIAAEHARNSEILSKQFDVSDLFKSIFHPGTKPDSTLSKSGITLLPSIASNPTIGSQIGIKALAGRKLGNDPNTFMSVAATSASITTKGILYFYVNHNLFSPGNKWNFQGNLVAAKSVTPDFGIGIGGTTDGNEADRILTNAERKEYVLHSLYFNFREKVYKQIYTNLYAGAGVSFDVRKNIRNRASDSEITPYKIYNERYGFNQSSYSANGLFFNLQYITRDNQNRSYEGIYSDIGVRVNQSWMGSSKNSVVFTTDFRKYWSLSSRNPEHVIAFWNWSACLLSGSLPYLERPGTGKDAASRSGRGYTIGYFTGTQYFYSEGEYRFPITRNKFLSGAAFFNIQTANDDISTKLFRRWQPGGGAGLRILFNKATRVNLCIDYAWGNYQSRGLFLGLNEAF